MKASTRTNGRCVSCGRRAGRSDCHCPYCGEQVWRSPVWRAARWSVLALPPVLTSVLAALAARGWAATAIRRLTEHPASAFLFAAGTGLLLLPAEDGDVAAGSPAELRRRQVLALLGGWAMGVCAAAGAAAAVSCAAPYAAAAALSSGLSLSIAAMPFFLRIPWRSLLAATLLAVAIAAGSR